MKIYISPEYKDIKNQLEDKGYEIIEENSNIICDAIICNLKMGELKKVNLLTNVKNEGTLIIDLGNKSADEIECIINNKVYSSIF